jgi:hypothetical protein
MMGVNITRAPGGGQQVTDKRQSNGGEESKAKGEEALSYHLRKHMTGCQK